MTVIRCDLCGKEGCTIEGGMIAPLPDGWAEIRKTRGASLPFLVCSARCFLWWGMRHFGVSVISDGLGGDVFVPSALNY